MALAATQVQAYLKARLGGLSLCLQVKISIGLRRILVYEGLGLVDRARLCEA